MDPLHERLAWLALSAAAPFGFALAGGYAVQAHGFLRRPSADVDIFASSRAECDFTAAVDAVLTALHRDGLTATADPRNSSFARITVATPEGEAAKLEMGVDWRANEPQLLSIGPSSTLTTPSPTRSAHSSAGQRTATTSTSAPSSPAAGTRKRNCSPSRRPMTPASTGCGSPRPSPTSADAPTGSSSPMGLTPLRSPS